MSVIQGLLPLIRRTLLHAGQPRLVRVVLGCGEFCGLEAESLAWSWALATRGGPLSGSELAVEPDPGMLACGVCGRMFPACRNGSGQAAGVEEAGADGLGLSGPLGPPGLISSACPECGCLAGHRIVSGQEVFLDRIEVETEPPAAGQSGGGLR
jgi:Zn finger protein HypA/HybF involved in hydrogenase expression